MKNKNKKWIKVKKIKKMKNKIKCHVERQRRTLFNGKGSIQEEDITNINIYAPNIGIPRYLQ